MRQNYEVIVDKEDGIFSKIEIRYSTNLSLFAGMNPVIRKVLEEHSADQKNVTSLNVTKEGENVRIELIYTKFNLFKLIKGKNEKEQIIAVLEQLDYPIDKIRKVEYEKKWNVDEVDDRVWKVEIDEHYDPDESRSQQSDEIYMSRMITRALGFEVSVSMY